MSYTPTTWQSGDVVTATKMNKIEQGIAGAGGLTFDFVGRQNYGDENSNPEYVSGNYNSVAAKCANHEPVFACFYWYDGTVSDMFFRIAKTISYIGTEILFEFEDYEGSGVYLLWNSSNDLMWD